MKANICGDKIKSLREDSNMKQVDLSAAMKIDHEIEIDQSDISEIERGVRGVKDYELKAIAEIFEVTTDWLLEE